MFCKNKTNNKQVIMVIVLIVGVIGAYAIITSVMDAIRIEKKIEQDKENIINTVHDKYNTPSIPQQQAFKEDIKKEFDLAKKRCEEKLSFATIFGIEEELKNVYGINNVKAVSNNNLPEIEIKKDGMTAYVDINNNVRIK